MVYEPRRWRTVNTTAFFDRLQMKMKNDFEETVTRYVCEAFFQWRRWWTRTVEVWSMEKMKMNTRNEHKSWCLIKRNFAVYWRFRTIRCSQVLSMGLREVLWKKNGGLLCTWSVLYTYYNGYLLRALANRSNYSFFFKKILLWNGHF